MALGGVRDEAEIRGHRRTYIGSMPGKDPAEDVEGGVRNPLFLLDEVDKMGMDVRGDPASALLEVLDPEQNNTFNDHYLEIDYDLSDVFFVCTSNSMNIPAPLLDRMEVIRLPGYTEDEKLNIARRYLVPKQIQQNGLAQCEADVETMRSCSWFATTRRKPACGAWSGRSPSLHGKWSSRRRCANRRVKASLEGVTIPAMMWNHYNGVRKYSYGLAEDENQVGIVTGLAWTQVGGELLSIEAVAVPVKVADQDWIAWRCHAGVHSGCHHLCPQSIGGARHPQRLSRQVRPAHSRPEGATPKDGPSAGIGMCTALVSVITGIPVRATSR